MGKNLSDEAAKIPPAYVSWTHEGEQSTQVSPAYKHALILLCHEQYQCKTLVETGTYMGDTIGAFRHFFEHICSIELNPEYYSKAAKRFEGCYNVHLIHGDSQTELAKLLPSLTGPVLFWLDAHLDKWCGPVVKELEAIYVSGIKGVILVDDMDFIADTLPKHPDWPQEYLNGIVRMIHVG